MATKGVPTNPANMRRRQTSHTPSQAYNIELLAADAWVLVDYTRTLSLVT